LRRATLADPPGLKLRSRLALRPSCGERSRDSGVGHPLTGSFGRLSGVALTTSSLDRKSHRANQE